MLKAVNTGSYWKKSSTVAGKRNHIFTYEVSGTAKEIAEYLAAQAEQQGKAVEDLPKSNGKPMFWFTQDLRAKRVAQKTFNLVVTVNGNIVADTTAEDMDRDLRILAKSEDHTARIIAEMELGLHGNAAPATVDAPAQKQLTEDAAPVVKDEVDNAIAEMGAGAEVKEPAGTLENE